MPHPAKLLHPPWRRYVLIPNWYDLRSPRWSEAASPFLEAESLKCGEANGDRAFVGSER